MLFCFACTQKKTEVFENRVFELLSVCVCACLTHVLIIGCVCVVWRNKKYSRPTYLNMQHFETLKCAHHHKIRLENVSLVGFRLGEVWLITILVDFTHTHKRARAWFKSHATHTAYWIMEGLYSSKHLHSYTQTQARMGMLFKQAPASGGISQILFIKRASKTLRPWK